MKFIFETQTNSSSSYPGKSGKRYLIYKGRPFEVTDKMDIEFFENNSRFRKAKGKDNKVVLKEDIEESLYNKLEKIYGVSKRTAKKVVDIYVSEETLIQAIEGGGNLGVELSKKQVDLIIKKLTKRGA